MNLLTVIGVTDWMFKMIRSLFITIDRVVYAWIENCYELLIKLSESGIFSQSTIQEFANRIYVFLGLIMIFRVSITLVQYIINPQNFNDKAIGGAALVKNVAFVLVGIVLVPYVFEAAYGLQRIVLKDNVIGNLILGLDADMTGGETTGADTDATVAEGKNGTYYAEYGGKIMAFQIFSAFFTFNNEIASSSCINNPVVNGKFNTEACGGDQGINGVPFEGGKDENGEELSYAGDYVAFAYRTGDFRALANHDLAALIYESENGDYELFDYYFLLSTIAGIVVIFLLLSFCVDVAVRSVKLGFLQLIAPIPLIMKVAPGKEGQGRFDKWVKECISTYLDLFTRLAAIYFSIFIIAEIARNGVVNVAGSQNNVTDSLLVRVFIIFAALFFAKQIPTLIADIIGGNKEKMQALSKKIGGLQSAAVGAAVGGTTMAGANLWATKRYIDKFKDPNKGYGNAFSKAMFGHENGLFNDANGNRSYSAFKHNLGSMWSNSGGFIAGGAIASAARGAKGGYKAGGSLAKGISAGAAAKQKSSGIREAKKIYSTQGYGIKDRIIDTADIYSGVANQYATTGAWDEKYKDIQNEIADAGSQENEMYHQMANLQNRFIESGGDYSTFNSMLNSYDKSDVRYDTDVDNNPGNFVYSSYDDFADDQIANSILDSDEKARYDKYTSDINQLYDKKYSEANNISNEERQAKVSELRSEQKQMLSSKSGYNAKRDELKSQGLETTFNQARQLGSERARLNRRGQKLKKDLGGIDKIRNSTNNGKK